MLLSPMTASKRRVLPSDDDSETSEQPKRVRWDAKQTIDQNSTSEPDSSDEDSAPARKVIKFFEAYVKLLTLGKIFLAAYCLYGRLGCAYYDPETCKIRVLEDNQESKHYDLTKFVLEQAEPDMLLTSSRSDEEFIDTLREHAEATGCDFQIRPHKDFLPGKGRDRILSLNLLSELPHQSDFDASDSSSEVASVASRPRDAYAFMSRRRDEAGDPNLKRWNAAIRLSNFACAQSSPVCMAAVGALLDHLVRENAMSDLEDEGLDGLEVKDIEVLSLDKAMHINADALLSLQIFEAESHASVHSDKTKEGLSLYGILNTTKTSLGKALLRAWLHRPSLDCEVINARLDAVECFVNPINAVPVSSLQAHLKGIKNVPRILAVMRTGRAKLSDWQALLKFTFHATMLREAICELHGAKNVKIVKELLDNLDVATFREVGSTVNDTIDWEESALAGRVCVRPHIDEVLDNKKHIYHGIDSVLSKVAQQICDTVPPDYATSLNVVYFPQLGFLICVPMLDEWRGEDGVKVMDGWNFQFSSEAHVYFKSQEMHDMDTHIGDLHSSIVDREIEILQSLLSKILVEDENMSRACDVCAELDCLLAFADASRAYNYARPEIVEEDTIEVVKGRHPLQEHTVDTFVANDAYVRSGGGLNSLDKSPSQEGNINRVLICTGANACGKSVYLKQIALIQFMAQIGCFVPAESAVLGIVDKIFTRVSTRESVSTVQSAFMIDLNQVSLAVRNSTSRSLILLDEFGKGTLSTGSYCGSALILFPIQLTPTSYFALLSSWILYYDAPDGAGLFCGVIKHFISRGPNCPKVLAATHFHDVFHKDLFDVDNALITFLHMQVMLSTDCELPNESASGSATSFDSPRRSSSYSSAGRDKITYLYRVAEGLSLESHAAKCAEMFGLPSRIVERARYINRLLSSHELGPLLDEEMSEPEKKELKEAEDICRRFLVWDLESKEDEKVKARLGAVLGRIGH